MDIIIKLIDLITKPFRTNYSISETSILDKIEMIEIGDKTQITEYVVIRAHENQVKLGKYCQISPFVVILGGSGVTIGDNVLIGPGTVIAAGNHDYQQNKKPIRFAGSISKGPIIIEDNVWIGANCTITDGVTIGQNSVIGANSVVTKNVPENVVYAGAPAKLLFKRDKK